MQQSESIWSKVLPLQVIESRRGYDSNQTSQPLRKRGLSSSRFKHILPSFRLVILSCPFALLSCRKMSVFPPVLVHGLGIYNPSSDGHIALSFLISSSHFLIVRIREALPTRAKALYRVENMLLMIEPISRVRKK